MACVCKTHHRPIPDLSELQFLQKGTTAARSEPRVMLGASQGEQIEEKLLCDSRWERGECERNSPADTKVRAAGQEVLQAWKWSFQERPMEDQPVPVQLGTVQSRSPHADTWRSSRNRRKGWPRRSERKPVMNCSIPLCYSGAGDRRQWMFRHLRYK